MSDLSPEGSLGQLANRTGVSFDNLLDGRKRAAAKLAQTADWLGAQAPSDVSLTMFGSWARGELTAGSDYDWAILTPDGRAEDDDVKDLAARCEQWFNADGKGPGPEDVFGKPFSWPPLANKIGLDDDSNSNSTRRMLTLFESVAISGPARDECWEAIIDRYLGWGVKDHRPPRFLLNDTIRYWRTICVDFEGKHKNRGGDDPGWVMRNAKLRTSRKMLFAGGLVPVLFCRALEEDGIKEFLKLQYAAPPTDRVAWAFEQLHMDDEGARCLAAYDEWLGLLQQQEFRDSLKRLRAGTRNGSKDFGKVREIGESLDRGLLALLFDSELGADARRYLVL